MSYEIVVSSTTEVISSGNSWKSSVKLPKTVVGGGLPVLPIIESRLLIQGTAEIINLAERGKPQPRMMTFKSTRPVLVTVNGTHTDNSEFSFTMLPLTYFQFLFDSPETYDDKVESLIIQAPPTLDVAPTPRPESYPNTLVEFVYAAVDTTGVYVPPGP